MSLQPNVPVVNAGMPYVTGLELTWLTGTTMQVATGQARNSTNVNDITMDTAVTINAAVIGQINGLDQGALANNTKYYVFAVADSRGYNTTGAIISASQTNPLKPFGYDMVAYLGMVKTSGAAAILDFTQIGSSSDRTMMYGLAIATAIVAGNATAFTAVDCSASIPTTADAVILKAALTPGAAGRSVSLRATGSTSAAGQNTMSGDVAAVVHVASMTVGCNSAGSFDYLVSNAGDAVALSIYGYVDQLI